MRDGINATGAHERVDPSHQTPWPRMHMFACTRVGTPHHQIDRKPYGPVPAVLRAFIFLYIFFSMCGLQIFICYLKFYQSSVRFLLFIEHLFSGDRRWRHHETVRALSGERRDKEERRQRGRCHPTYRVGRHRASQCSLYLPHHRHHPNSIQ